MKIKDNGFWVYYSSDEEANFTDDKVGKWMYFFGDYSHVESICKKAVIEEAISSCKHTANAETGVACFYLNIDDTEGHKKILQFFLDNNLIKITKSGKLTNISFKLDDQTRTSEYGETFKSKLTLSDFVDLTTRKFL